MSTKKIQIVGSFADMSTNIPMLTTTSLTSLNVIVDTTLTSVNEGQLIILKFHEDFQWKGLTKIILRNADGEDLVSAKTNIPAGTCFYIDNTLFLRYNGSTWDAIHTVNADNIVYYGADDNDISIQTALDELYDSYHNDTLHFYDQELTDAEKSIARNNIGATSIDDVNTALEEAKATYSYILKYDETHSSDEENFATYNKIREDYEANGKINGNVLISCANAYNEIYMPAEIEIVSIDNWAFFSQESIFHYTYNINVNLQPSQITYNRSNNSTGSGEIDVSSKMDKVTNGTSGNFISLDANGNAVDSGKHAESFVPIATYNSRISPHINDGNIHVTADEKSSWNAKLDESDLDSAIDAALAEAKESGEFDGVGIANMISVDSTSSGGENKLSIYLTDGNRRDFTYYNGKDGIAPTLSSEEIDGGNRIKITSTSNGAMSTKTFDVMDGKDGLSILRITTAPTSYTTTIGGFTPKYRIALSTVLEQSGASEVRVGDTILRNYYTYHVGYVDDSYVYVGAYASIRGSAGTSVTISGITESDEDGGENVVTFSDDKTLTVKNGSKGKDGYTPIKGVDYYTDAEKSEWSEYIASELAKRGQLKPEFANNIEECTDTTKLYVLPDGYVYAYMLTEKEVTTGPSYTNRLPQAVKSGGGEYVGDNGEDGYRSGYRYSASSNAEKAATGYELTGYIPVKSGDTVRIKNVTQITASNDGSGYCVAYFFADSYERVSGAAVYIRPTSGNELHATYEDGLYTFTVPSYDTIAYFRVTFKGVTADTIITVNEEITEGGGTTIVTEETWASTGLAFVPADYEDRIIDLENKVASLSENNGSGADVITPLYTNKLPLAVNSSGQPYIGDNNEDGYRTGYRVSSSGEEKAETGYDCTGFISVKAGDIVRIKNVTQLTASNDSNAYAVMYFFDSSYARATGALAIQEQPYADGVYTVTVLSYENIAFMRVTLKGVTADTIITVNEEIVEKTEISAPDTSGTSALELIKKWDAPIYDANIPVFELSTEKAAITSAEKTVAAVYAKYDALMARHPNYITKTDLGLCSDGVQHVYRYDFREPEPHRGTTGKKEWSETKTKAIIISGIHWEWGGIFALYNALEEIADNPALLDFRRNTHIIVLPVCNPYAVANQSVRNANQVEIHRNFEVDFIYPNEEGYIPIGERSHGGTTPLSEIETQYIDNIMKNNTDAAFFLTCHSCQGDEVYGTSFIWSSPATYHMCNMAYRLIDKLSNAWNDKYGDELADGIADYRTANLPEWDTRLGMAYLSTTNGTEQKQATKYGIQGTNVEITDAFLTHGTKASPETALSSFTMSRGAEVYVNFLLTALGVYDYKDKKQYTSNA